MRFTVRRPPTGEVSPCGHRPPGGDVACSVDVGVTPSGSAGFALEDRLALAVSRCDVPTRGATLRRVCSRDLLDPAEGLVLQTRDEQAPSTSADRAIEPAFLRDSRTWLFRGAARGARHRPHVEVLDPDHVEPPRQVGAGLLDPVLTPIPLAGFQFRDRSFRRPVTVGTPPATGQPLLQHLQPLRLSWSKARRAEQLAGRQRRGHGDTAVDAYHAAVTRTGDRVGDVRERDMPTTSPITSNPVGPDTLGHRPREAKPHGTDLRYPDPTKTVVQPPDVMRFHSDLSKPFMHPGLAPCRAAVRASEEAVHGLREISQRLLLHCLAPGPKPRVLGAGLRQLGGLLPIAGSLAARLPVLLLLDRQVPDIPRISAVRQQRLLLVRGRQQSKPRHIRTVTATTDIGGRRTPAPVGISLVPGPKLRVSSRRRLR